MIGHLAPALHHLLAHLVAIVAQIGIGTIAVSFQQFQRTLLHLGLVGKVAVLQRVAHLLQFGIKQVPSCVDHVTHPVLDPIGILVAEVERVGTRCIVAAWHTAGTAVDWRECHHAAVIVAPPNHATHFTRHEAAQLAHIGEGRVRSRHWTLVEHRGAVIVIAQRLRAEGAVVEPRTRVIVHGKRRTLEVVAHTLYHIVHREFLVRNNPHGQRFHLAHGLDTLDIGQIAVHPALEVAVNGPSACVAQSASAKGGRIVGVTKTEVLVLTLEKAHLARKADAVFRHLHIGGVGQVHLADAALVRVRQHGIVGHSHSHPGHAFATLAATHQFQQPRLVGVAHAETLAGAAVTIFLHQARHHLNGLARCLRPLQPQVHEAAIVNDAIVIEQFVTALKGGLPYAHLPLVDVACHQIGNRSLRYLAVIHACVAVINLAHGASWVGAGLIPVHSVKRAPRVNAVGAHHTAVGTRILAHHNVGAGIAWQCQCQGGKAGSQYNSHSFHHHFFSAGMANLSPVLSTSFFAILAG